MQARSTTGLPLVSVVIKKIEKINGFGIVITAMSFIVPYVKTCLSCLPFLNRNKGDLLPTSTVEYKKVETKAPAEITWDDEEWNDNSISVAVEPSNHGSSEMTKMRQNVPDRPVSYSYSNTNSSNVNNSLLGASISNSQNPSPAPLISSRPSIIPMAPVINKSTSTTPSKPQEEIEPDMDYFEQMNLKPVAATTVAKAKRIVPAVAPAPTKILKFDMESDVSAWDDDSKKKDSKKKKIGAVLDADIDIDINI